MLPVSSFYGKELWYIILFKKMTMTLFLKKYCFANAVIDFAALMLI